MPIHATRLKYTIWDLRSWDDLNQYIRVTQNLTFQIVSDVYCMSCIESRYCKCVLSYLVNFLHICSVLGLNAYLLVFAKCMQATHTCAKRRLNAGPTSDWVGPALSGRGQSAVTAIKFKLVVCMRACLHPACTHTCIQWHSVNTPLSVYTPSTTGVTHERVR